MVVRKSEQMEKQTVTVTAMETATAVTAETVLKQAETGMAAAKTRASKLPDSAVATAAVMAMATATAARKTMTVLS